MEVVCYKGVCHLWISAVLSPLVMLRKSLFHVFNHIWASSLLQRHPLCSLSERLAGAFVPQFNTTMSDIKVHVLRVWLQLWICYSLRSGCTESVTGKFFFLLLLFQVTCFLLFIFLFLIKSRYFINFSSCHNLGFLFLHCTELLRKGETVTSATFAMAQFPCEL